MLKVDPRDWRAREHWTHPWMNDVHHVNRWRGALHVVSTGLDGLLELDPHESAARLRPALDEDPWSRFDRARDWRRVATTKPHRAHPNFVFYTQHGTWLTRFEQRDAICLDDPGRRIDIGIGIPHDGHPVGERVWFTTTNGHLLEADPEKAEVVTRYDLNAIDGGDSPLGWCRGLLVDGDVAWVGFSCLRSTVWRENLNWLAGRLGQAVRATRISAFDLARRALLAEWSFEGGQLDAIYSILPASPGAQASAARGPDARAAAAACDVASTAAGPRPAA